MELEVQRKNAGAWVGKGSELLGKKGNSIIAIKLRIKKMGLHLRSDQQMEI